MTEREDPIRRRQSSGPKPRETIEELYGDVLAPKPIGLFDAVDPGPEDPHHRDADFSDLADKGPKSPHSIYRPTAEGAPGRFKRSGRLEYPRNGGDLTPVVLSHGLVTLFTLGIWRFWQITAQRRSVWSHTKLAGEPFEYRGSGIEMFIGAAIAMVILGALMLVFQMALGWIGLSAPLGFEINLPLLGLPLTLASLALLPPLVEYARFRARRYRLRRTRWRGIRFDMRGRGLGLVLRWALWTPVVIATLGLAWPFLTTTRERYMTNRTFWGEERFFFRGSAWRLMPYWAVLWLMVAVPAAVGAAHVWQVAARADQTTAAPEMAEIPPNDATADAPAADGTPAPDAAPNAAPDAAAPAPAPIVPPSSESPVVRLNPTPPTPESPPESPPNAAPEPPSALQQAVRMAAPLIPLRDRLIAAAAPILNAAPATQQLLALLWPLLVTILWFGFRGARIRMHMNARRIAGARARSTFGGGALFQAWLAVVGRSIWPGVLVYVLATIVIVILLTSIDMSGRSATGPMDMVFGSAADWRSQGLVVMALAINYGSIALFSMWLYDVVWFRAFFHRLCASTHIEGLETLDHVRQRPQAAAAEADGLADALNLDAEF